MMENYILENRIPRLVRSQEELIAAWGDSHRRVRSNNVGDVHVSTVFLPLDHKFWKEGPPVVFETMVFGGEDDQYQRRYTNWDEAVLGHQEILHEVNKREWDRLYGDMWEYLTGVFIMKWFVNNVLL